MTRPTRRLWFAVAAAVAVLAISIPALAAAPSTPPGQAGKPDKGPEVAVTLEGTIETATDADGRVTYTLTADGKTWTLSAGPAWYMGENNPLAGHVGDSVTIVGTTHEGESEVDVESIDGTAIREPGKPPWAGGPWVVGSTHPGWKDWMADGKPGKGHGHEAKPDKSHAPDDDDADEASPAP